MPYTPDVINISWALKQTATITLTKHGGGTYTIGHDVRGFPTFTAAGSTFALVPDTLGGQAVLSYWSTATTKVMYVLNNDLTWFEYTYDSVAGTTIKTDYGTFA